MVDLPQVTFIGPVVEERFRDIDVVVAAIVDAILDRNLRAGEHVATFDRFGDRAAHFTHVRAMQGPGYRLKLNRAQGRIGGHGTIADRFAGVARAVVPGHDLGFFSDGFGPVNDPAEVAQVVRWLEEHVLAPILGYPVVPGAHQLIVDPQPIPYPSDLGPLLTRCDHGTWAAFQEAQQRGDDVVRRSQMVSVPFVFETSASVFGLPLVIPGLANASIYTGSYMLLPHWANDLVVLDWGPYQDALAPGTALTLGDCDEAVASLLGGAVPIQDYHGGAKLPVVLLRRHVVPSEVQLIAGSWPAMAGMTQPDSERVLTLLHQEAPAEYAMAALAWKAFSDPAGGRDSSYDASIVEDAVTALTAVVAQSHRLVSLFLEFQASTTAYGEPATSWDFVRRYTQQAGEATRAVTDVPL